MVKQYVVHCVYLQSAHHSALSIVTRVTKDQSCAAARARPRASLNFEKFEICKMVPSKIGPCHVMSSLEIYLHPIHFCIPSFPLSPTWTYFAGIRLCRGLSRLTQPQHHRKYEDNSIPFLQSYSPQLMTIDDQHFITRCWFFAAWLMDDSDGLSPLLPSSQDQPARVSCPWAANELHPKIHL